MSRILVVDDERVILLSLSAILEMNGYEVETASCGREAIDKLENGTYEAVLTDMNMETETAGYDVVCAARKANHGTKIALLTGYPSRCQEWRELGAHALLEKPIRPEVLLARIAALLGKPGLSRRKLESTLVA